MQNLSMQEAKANLDKDKDIVLLDIRTRMEYKEGHLPGAINMPWQEIVHSIDEVAPDLEQTIYIYCHSGVRTLTAGTILDTLGYDNVYNLGGIIDWSYEIEK